MEVYDHNLYDPAPGRVPTRNGPLDARLGTVSKTELCETCGLDQKACNGHWGVIKLFYPCFHIGFLAFTIDILNQVCKVNMNNQVCKEFLLTPKDMLAHLT